MLRTLSTLAVSFACLSAAAQEIPAPAPLDPRDPMIKMENFGPARVVQLLGDAMKDDDPLVRERAVKDLGDTHNPPAVAFIRQAATDEDPRVRAAAVNAAAQFDANLTGQIILRGLGDDREVVVLAALRSALTLRPAGWQGAAIKLLSRTEQPEVQSAALFTLTQAGAAAGADALGPLLKSPSAPVRLRACENASMLTEPGPLAATLADLAGRDLPAVRATALAALAKGDGPDLDKLQAAARDSDDPILRRGSALAARNRGQDAQLAAFLNDGSAMVRYAAIVAVGERRYAPAVPRVLELMLAATDEGTHIAGRVALTQIGTPSAKAVAATFRRDANDLMGLNQRFSILPSKRPSYIPSEHKALQEHHRRLRRNLATMARLMGEIDSRLLVPDEIAMLTRLPEDSPILVEVAIALAKLNVQEACPVLQKLLEVCGKNGMAALRAELALQPPPLPYSESVTGAVAWALGELKYAPAAQTCISVANIFIARRLSPSGAYCIQALANLADGANRERIEKFIQAVPTDATFDRTAKYAACIVIGRLKVAAGVEGLQDMLTEQRDGKIIMRAAAWGIQAVTGTTPPIGEPEMRQGEWLIRVLRQR